MIEIETAIIQQISTKQAWHYEIVPFRKEQNALFFYHAKEKDMTSVVEELEMLFTEEVIFEPLDTEQLKQYLGKYYRQYENGQSQAKELDFDQNFLDALILEAKQLGSSDIHIEPYEERARVRFRIDGALMEKYQIKKETYPSLVNKIKIKANLDIAEKRLPQDGRIFYANSNIQFDIRVSSMPTLYGEKIVMRLLNSGDTRIDIEALGIDHSVLEKYLEGVNRPNGIVLISGPTGSGKTTTLYATLQILNEHSRNIVTVEDPIEYTLEGINQVQVRESIGLNFASAIKTFLRQDPDIIMLGEIRDLETATMAIRASLTGHLVLSTIHTNSAWGIIPRLIDMGVPSYLLADTMNLAVAQRLVRLLCPKCKESAPLSKEDLPRHFKVNHLPTQQMIPKGCDYCHYSGYKGRVGVYEIIPINDELSDAIREQELKVSHLLERAGVQTLSENAFRLFKEGKTSLKEVYPLLWRKA